jgi:hypothetical protein
MGTFSDQRHRVALQSVSSKQDVGGLMELRRLYNGALAAFEGHPFEAADTQVGRVSLQDEFLATALNTKTGVYVQLRGKPNTTDLLLSIGRKFCVESVDPTLHQATTFLF